MFLARPHSILYWSGFYKKKCISFINNNYFYVHSRLRYIERCLNSSQMNLQVWDVWAVRPLCKILLMYPTFEIIVLYISVCTKKLALNYTFDIEIK